MGDSTMILIGMFDSPFVRRVAISLRLLGFGFDHRNWSVGRDFALIQQYNPLGRVPTLVLEDGTSLLESAAILDYLDDRAGPQRALLPATGAARRDALRIMAIAVGAAEKGVLQLYEGVFRPAAKRHEPWVERCKLQMHAALAELEKHARSCGDREWLVGSRMTQADVTVACIYTFLSEALPFESTTAYPLLSARTARCEALPAFQGIKAAFFPPATDASTNAT